MRGLTLLGWISLSFVLVGGAVDRAYGGYSSYNYWACFLSAGQTYKVNPWLLYAIAKVESGLNPKALNINRNGSKDRGIMQINTSWDTHLRRHGVDPRWVWDPCYNIHLGAMVLRHCINRYGNTWRAVDCYNKGNRAKHTSRYVWKVYTELSRLYARR